MRKYSYIPMYMEALRYHVALTEEEKEAALVVCLE